MQERVAHLPPFGVRLMPSLKAKLQASANANGRSLNREINFQLDRLFREATAATGETLQGETPAAAQNETACQGGSHQPRF